MIDNINFQVGERIKYFRQLRDLTLDQLADYANVDYSYMSKVERGTVNCSILKLHNIASALKVDLHELFVFNNTPSQFNYIKEISAILEKLEEDDIRNLFAICSAFYLSSKNKTI